MRIEQPDVRLVAAHARAETRTTTESLHADGAPAGFPLAAPGFARGGARGELPR